VGSCDRYLNAFAELEGSLECQSVGSRKSLKYLDWGLGRMKLHQKFLLWFRNNKGLDCASEYTVHSHQFRRVEICTKFILAK
jgi:hypothetical protein